MNTTTFGDLDVAALETRAMALHGQLPCGPLTSQKQLLLAEEALDALGALPTLSPSYTALLDKARVYVASHPELLQMKWPRAAGAVIDLIVEAREALLQAQEYEASQLLQAA